MKLNVIKLSNKTSLYTQLCFEEYLYRHSKLNYLIIKDNNKENKNLNNNDEKNIKLIHNINDKINKNNINKKPLIVLGISAKVNELVNKDIAINDNIKLLKRFTGGGTVIIDNNCCLISFIITNKNNKNNNIQNLLYPKHSYPRDIMKWSEDLIYSNVFNDLLPKNSNFHLKDNDYVIFNDKKIGGNAQAISSSRFVHHTSFLFNYNKNLMEKYLKLPTNQPDYRKNRKHSDFLFTLNDYINDQSIFSNKIIEILKNKNIDVKIINNNDNLIKDYNNNYLNYKYKTLYL